MTGETCTMSKTPEKRPPNRPEFIRTQSLRLPTPPPDPTQTNNESTELTDKENEFLEYLNSLPVPSKPQQNEKPTLQRAGSIFAPAMATEDAFDHLDKLYKLMEQLLNLREQNAKLQRRVRDLEHLRNLQSLDQQVTSRILRGEEAEVPDLDDDSVLAEALLDNMFTSGRNKRSTKHKSPPQFRLRQSILRPPRDRSLSMAVDGSVDALPLPRNASGKSLPERGILRKPSKVSKWTKVKAAFKWEKASPTVSGAKSQDSGIGGMMPVNNEIARYLRVPSTCDNPTDAGTSPADSVLSGSWNAVHGLSTPGTLSPASSTDDLNASAVSDHRSVSRTGSAGNSNASGKQFRTSRTSDEEDGERRSRSLDFTGSYSCENSQAVSKDDLIKHQGNKSHKTPWGKVKDIIQTRKDSLKKKQHRLSARSDDCRTDYSAGSDQEDVFEAAIVHDTPTVTVTNSEDTTTTVKEKQTSFVDNGRRIPADIVARYQRVAAEEEKNQGKYGNGSPRGQRRISKWTKVKKAFLTSASHSRNYSDSRSVPASPTNKYNHFFNDIPPIDWKNAEDRLAYMKKSDNDLENRKLKDEIQKNYAQLQKKLSQEFQEKLQEWEKVKLSCNPASTTVGGSQIAGSAGTTSEDQRDPEFVRKMEEWEKIKHQNSSETNKRRNLQLTSEENLPADFRKKLQEWQKIKKFGGKEEENVASRKKKSEWQLWRSNSSNKQENSLSLGQPDGRQFSEDFLRKLDEWKQMKASHSAGEDQDHRKSLKENKSSSPGLARKSSGSKLIRQSKNHKMQEWLEKELQKIEREKQRLEREREKFLEREERLAKLRRTIGNSPHKKDVLVQTSTGFYRFEGISRKFTQKLYEWEKARGIGPEDSTFALLSSGYNQMFPHPARATSSNSYRHEPTIKLTRSKSMDSVANLTCVGSVMTHQPSSLSLNDVEELEMQCLAESQSERNLNESEDNLDYGEPEAVIVEVEDFVEETAAPLEAIKENHLHHTPVYQTEVLKLCESEKCEAPEVRRSESARALSNYNLIQESLNILNKMRDIEETCRATEAKINTSAVSNQEKESYKSTGAIPKRQINTKFNSSLQASLNSYYIQQSEMSEGLTQKILLLQEANISDARHFTNKKCGFTISQINDTLNISQDLSAELKTIVEKLKLILSERRTEFNAAHKELRTSANKYGQDICEILNLLIVKIRELKRSLSYLCAASDMTAPGRRKKGSFKNRRSSFHKRASLDQISIPGTEKPQINDTSDEEDQKNGKTKFPRRKEKLVKSKSEDNQMLNYAKLQVTSYGDNRKERSERSYKLNRTLKSSSQAHLYSQSLDNNEKLDNKNQPINNEKDILESLRKTRCQRKLIRTRRISDSQSDSTQKLEETTNPQSQENQIGNHEPIVPNSNIIVPTHIQYVDATSNFSNVNESVSSSPVSVFIHTTRKLFTPFASEVIEKKDENELNTNDVRYSSPKLNENVTSTEIEINKNNLLRRSHSPSDSPLLPRKRRMTISNNEEPKNNEVSIDNNQPEVLNSRPTTPSCLPPLPNSPIAQRRERHLTKETSPAIRLMIARYNQKLSEQDSPGNKSAGSSGSASPVAWRSPVFERRVKTQTEKYEEEVNKTLLNTSGYSPLFMRKQVQKSASVGVIHPVKKQITTPEVTQRGISLDSSETNSSPKLIRGILKSTSMGSMKTNPQINTPIEATTEEPEPSKLDQNEAEETKTLSKITDKAPSLKLSIPPPKPADAFKMSPNSKDRAHKLQKAKEEFLLQKTDTPSAGASSAPFTFQRERELKYPARNRLSQVSFGSESSCDDMKYSGLLVKSASAGMINVDEATYEQFRPEMHSQGYVSLPRATKKKDGKFGISSLASKFRKVKMRRSKDPAQMNTISTLCRQSLVVDITGNEQENATGSSDDQNKKKSSQDRSSSSTDVHSPSTSKSSWIKNPSKIFKPK